MLNIAKTLFRKLVNRFRIPSVIDFILKPWKEALANAKPAKTNWSRLGLEKSWELFLSVFLVIFLYAKSILMKFIVDINAKIDTLNYQGSSSPLTIVYKANAVIFFIDQVLTVLAISLIIYLTYSFFKKGK